MASQNAYEMFDLVGNEFTFDVDLSALPCGLNGALYFVSMPEAGQGTPGAKYGTGEFDASLDVILRLTLRQDTVMLSALVT